MKLELTRRAEDSLIYVAASRRRRSFFCEVIEGPIIINGQRRAHAHIAWRSKSKKLL